MRNKIFRILTLLIFAAFAWQSSSAQFSRIRRLPKPERAKSQTPPPTPSAEPQTRSEAQPGQPQPSSSAHRVYEDVPPPNKPMFVKDSLYIQAQTYDSYWKLPAQSNYSSWGPKIRFGVFYDGSGKVDYKADYFNPDGSLWFSEPLEHDSFTGNIEDGPRLFSSRTSYSELAKKATPAIGSYSFKITNTETGEVVFQGKFKVGKTPAPNNEKDRNKFDFFVEHDWLLPIGYVGFDQNMGFEIGGRPVVVRIWLKGNPEVHDLEARLFYKGQQIATTAGGGGAVSDAEERAGKDAALTADLHEWKLWRFWWQKRFVYANGDNITHENMPEAFFADKNPGEYTVKVYRNGAQVRELKFNIGSDGKLVDGGYGKPIFLTEHKVIVPVKIIGTSEKWDPSAWKTDAFYSNPLTGFNVP